MNIKIQSLRTDEVKEKTFASGYIYKDIEFDLEPAVSYNRQLNKNEYLRDVQALFDEESVKNSIVTCFLTSPGQKILNPLFGIDLRRFCFEPVDDFVADIIQNEIEVKLPVMEPRVVVKNVSVEGNEEEQQYDVYLQLDIPSLNIVGLSIKSKLNSIGYTLL